MTDNNNFTSVALDRSHISVRLNNRIANLLIDTGIFTNILKLRYIPRNNRNCIDTSNTPEFIVNTTRFPTLGTIILNVENYAFEFYVINNDVNICQDGILGINFLNQANAVLDYGNNCIRFYSWETLN